MKIIGWLRWLSCMRPQMATLLEVDSVLAKRIPAIEDKQDTLLRTVGGHVHSIESLSERLDVVSAVQRNAPEPIGCRFYEPSEDRRRRVAPKGSRRVKPEKPKRRRR